jgi:hypothetical protein
LRLGHLSEEKKDVIHTNLRENKCVLERQLSEMKANINYGRNLE